MDEFPEMAAFPDQDGMMANATVDTVHYCFGALAGQDGDDLFNIHLHLALGPTPQQGFATVNLTADSARSLARHLLLLAEYAELGVEAEHPDE